MKKVSAPEVVTTLEAPESPLPPQIQEALGELVGAAKEGLLALSVGVGLGVVHELMELEVDEVVGPRGKWNPDRTAKRHGHENGSMTLGGRRVQVSRPRMRTSDDEHELPVQTYQYFADRDPLTRVVMDRVLAEDVGDRAAQRLAAVDDEQDRLVGIQAAVDQVGQQRPRECRVLGAAFPEPERDLHALGRDPERDDVRALSDLQPVEHHHRQADVVQPAAHQL